MTSGELGCIDGSCTRPIDADKLPDLVHYTIVRADLPIGSQVAQTVHAAGDSFAAWVSLGNEHPRDGQTIAVALRARDEDHLLEIRERLNDAGIANWLVSDGDARDSTRPNGRAGLEAMAIGVYPTRDRSSVKRLVSGVPLVR